MLNKSSFLLLLGLFRAVPYLHDWDEDFYIDGGVLCNYPIHAYDGMLK